MLDTKNIKIRAAELCIQAMLQHDTSIMDEADRLSLMVAMVEFLLGQITKSHAKWGNVHDRNMTLEVLKKANAQFTENSPFEHLLNLKQ